MYAVNLLFGSMTALPIEFRVVSSGLGAGKFAPVTFVKVAEPVVVAKTFPSRMPTILTLSSCGEIPIVVITTPTGKVGFGGHGAVGQMVPVGTSGAWLTRVIVSPRFEERQSRSDPK